MLTVDSLSEVRSMEFYVPRDEAFSISKQGNTLMKAFNSMLHGFLLPALEDNFNKHNSTLFETKHDRSPCPKLVQILTDKAMDILLLHSSQTSYGKHNNFIIIYFVLFYFIYYIEMEFNLISSLFFRGQILLV